MSQIYKALSSIATTPQYKKKKREEKEEKNKEGEDGDLIFWNSLECFSYTKHLMDRMLKNIFMCLRFFETPNKIVIIFNYLNFIFI